MYMYVEFPKDQECFKQGGVEVNPSQAVGSGVATWNENVHTYVYDSKKLEAMFTKCHRKQSIPTEIHERTASTIDIHHENIQKPIEEKHVDTECKHFHND